MKYEIWKNVVGVIIVVTCIIFLGVQLMDDKTRMADVDDLTKSLVYKMLSDSYLGFSNNRFAFNVSSLSQVWCLRRPW